MYFHWPGSSRLAIGGFSDGASYALCVGLSNGSLFAYILAFSPGYVYTVEREGKPGVFGSHETQGGALPIGFCSRQIVPKLQDQGYQVNYQEFEAAHEVPDCNAKRGTEWLSNYSMKLVRVLFFPAYSPGHLYLNNFHSKTTLSIFISGACR